MEFNQNKSLLNNYVPFEKEQKEKEITAVILVIASKALYPVKTDIIYIYIYMYSLCARVSCPLSSLFLADSIRPWRGLLLL